MKKLRVSNSLDKSIDMGAIISSEQLNRINTMVSDSLKDGAELFQCAVPNGLEGLHFPPSLINKVFLYDYFPRRSIWPRFGLFNI